MDKEAVNLLLEKLEMATITREEKDALDNWYREISYADSRYPDKENIVEERIYRRLSKQISSNRPRRILKIRINKVVAAILIIVCGIGSNITYRSFQRPENHVTEKAKEFTDIGPGESKASLTLSDGRTISLEKNSQGIKIKGGISYSNGQVISENLTGPITLSVPKGGSYQVTLEDGSKIWLNSGSELIYPSRFSNNRREVRLYGEAYFVVSKDVKRPFIVKSNNQEIRVLGTEFNINAYPGTSAVSTTLVKGKVQILSTITNKYRELHPGQQSTVTGEDLIVKQVDIEPIVAWKKGHFNFENKSLETILDEFARWYNIEVRYEGSIPAVDLYGDIHKDVNLSFALQILESAGVQYEINGRVLTVRQKNNRK